jgi:(E)-4-hydroxy-3-methylbut-2-enyl-diphosphate synthase
VRLQFPGAGCGCIGGYNKRTQETGPFNPHYCRCSFNLSCLQVAEHADKVRINPGNFSDTARFIPLLEKCRSRGVALRIGVNHGSLGERIMDRYGDTPEGMAESAMEFLRMCHENHFDQVVVSMKASNIRVMVQATRLVAARCRMV